MIKSIVGSIKKMVGTPTEKPLDPAPDAPIEDISADEDEIITDTECAPIPQKEEAPAKPPKKQRPARALKRAALEDGDKTARYKKAVSERERTKRIREMSKELRGAIEAESERNRENQKKQREEKMERERESMTVQKIARTRAMKKLAPSARKRLGIYAQHELSKMIEERSRR